MNSLLAMSDAPTSTIAAALAQVGVRTQSVTLLSLLGVGKGRRLAYRVDAEDGRRFKVREFESETVAREVQMLRDGLEDAFAPVIERCGCVLLEEWIDGVALTLADANRLAEQAGAVLGRLHSVRLPSGAPEVMSTSLWRSGADDDVEMLATAGAITADEAIRAAGLLREQDPRSARAAIVHLDFCAENLVVDVLGKLRIIDNEQLAVEPAGIDLGRTFHRWPMSDLVWREFLRGYRSAGTSEPDATGFWRLVATVLGARVFLQRRPERLDDTIRLLRSLLVTRGGT